MKPSDKAEFANLRVTLRALEKGAWVSKPISEGTRYDLIVDYEGRLYRAQVKYSDGFQKSRSIGVRLHSGSYGKTRFRCYSSQEDRCSAGLCAEIRCNPLDQSRLL